MVVGVKSVTLPNVAPAFSSLSIRQTFDMHGFPTKRSLYVVSLYSPTLDIAFAFFLVILRHPLKGRLLLQA
jgi:hypothetical protein